MVLARSGRTRLPKMRSSPVYRRTQYQPSIWVTTARVEPAHRKAADEYKSLVSCCKPLMLFTTSLFLCNTWERQYRKRIYPTMPRSVGSPQQDCLYHTRTNNSCQSH